jgi:hypothetical protein
MDEQWAIGVLEWWVENAPKAQNRHQGRIQAYGTEGTAEMDALREHEDQTRSVLARVLNASPRPSVIDTWQGGGTASLSAGIELCKFALGRLRTQTETNAKLGSAAPTMAADSLHPLIWNSASDLWASGHYSDAVKRAATFLNAHVQDQIDRHDISDATLMKEAFSLAAPEVGKSRLRWPGDDDDQTVKSMRVGILQFAQGAFSAIRNPATHSTEDIERQEALEQLAALSILARWIEKCGVLSA